MLFMVSVLYGSVPVLWQKVDRRGREQQQEAVVVASVAANEGGGRVVHRKRHTRLRYRAFTVYDGVAFGRKMKTALERRREVAWKKGKAKEGRGIRG